MHIHVHVTWQRTRDTGAARLASTSLRTWAAVYLIFPDSLGISLCLPSTSRFSIFVMYSNNGGGGLPSLHVDGGACSIARLIAYSEYSGCKLSIESIVGYVE